MILKAFKFRLEPNSQQKVLINKTLGCTRFLYNQMLNEKQTKYKTKDNTKLKTEKEYKIEFDWLKEVDSIALQQSRIDLKTSYINHFRKLKNKQKTSLKFKSKHNPKNSYRTININNSIRIEDNKIKLPKLGFVRFKKSREVLGNIKSVTISKNILNKYYISVLSEVDIEAKPQLDTQIGIDLGLKEFCVTSNNEFISNPKYLRKLELKLKKAQRKLSKRVKNSINRFKQQKIVFKIHEKIRNQRLDFLHKLSSKLINENQVICLEDLSIKNMVKNHCLSKSIYDVSWSKFVELLVYKALWYGKKLVKIDKFFPSSKMCNNCKNIKHDLTLQDRIYKCNSCGNTIDRDYNSSLNILEEGLKILNSGRDDRDSLLNIETLVSSS
ncbi:MAG: IS200/IS605 family element RNA-guided endonuclease TnpB [Clostridia bacterium]|jgi:putative transposase